MWDHGAKRAVHGLIWPVPFVSSIFSGRPARGACGFTDSMTPSLHQRGVWVMSSLFAGLGVVTVLMQRWVRVFGLDLDNSLFVELACGAAAGALGGAIARVVINPYKRPSLRWGVLAGVFAVLLGHVAAMSMLTAPVLLSEQTMWTGLAKWALTALVFTFGSFALALLSAGR